jgi:hypothetical protein
MFNNSFTCTGGSGGGGALGFAIASNSANGDCRYRKINIHNNTFDGFYWGGYIPTLDLTFGTVPTDKIVCVIAENKIYNSASYPIYIWPQASEPSWRTGSQYNRIIIARNDMEGVATQIDQTNLGANPMIISDLDNF